MSEWFRGTLEGHYVGTPAAAPGVSQYGSAQRYKLRIYRALIQDIEVLDTLPEATPEEIPGDCFYQAQIEDTRLLGIRPRSCFEGPIYDVAVSAMEVTHTTKQGAKTYGRLEGTVYGRFVLPELAADGEDEELEQKPLAPQTVQPSGPSEQGQGTSSRIDSRDEEERDVLPLHAPSSATEQTEREPSHVPIPLLIVVMAIVLGLVGGAEPALLWLGAFVPIQAVRLILTGLFKVTRTQRVFGAMLILVQIVCLALMALDWWTDGCLSINVYAVAGIGVTALVASVLPSSLPLVCAGGSLGLVLFLWYGDLGVRCDQEQVEAPTNFEAPSVGHPGTPRTNADGSWPRRPPRTR